ncbi:MAG: DUF4412 domain-containing protein [Acidobacteriota bacterium]
MISRPVLIAAAVTLVCGLAGRADAADGIQLVQKMTTGTTSQTLQVQMDNTHMRTETALGFGMTDLDVTRQLADFYSKMVPQSADQIFSVGRMEDQGFSGFPVRHVFKIGPTQTTMEVTEAGRANIPASQFAVPAGFTKTEMPVIGMGAAGRRGR